MKKILLFFSLITLVSASLFAFPSRSFEIDVPSILIDKQSYSLTIRSNDTSHFQTEIKIGKEPNKPLLFINGKAEIEVKLNGLTKVAIIEQNQTHEEHLNPIPLWLSVIPPLVAIILALLFKEVVSSLIIGLFSGALIISMYSDGIIGLLTGFMLMIDQYIINALNDTGHLSIILFSLLIGGMVSLISKNGGMQGVVNRISTFATSAKSGQFSTWFLGIIIFFDDYANTLIVGNTMRPITDKLKISREKLAYLVDSTAAPMAAIAFITTWIGAELGYIASGTANISGFNEGVYATFINSLQYSFYPIFTLIFMVILIYKERDYGPMYSAEKKARESKVDIDSNTSTSRQLLEEFNPAENAKIKAYNALIPVSIVVFGTIAGLLYTGWDNSIWMDSSIGLGRKLSSTIGNADSYKALLWSSASGLISAILMSISQKTFRLSQTIEASIHGFKTMFPALIILVLAWSLALVIEDLHTADFLTSMMNNQISPYFVPLITFLLSAIVAFSTGSSWGTMAIVYPLMLPASWEISQAYGLDYPITLSIFHNVVASVLAGSVLGDHCSPISDTTILSSLASSCDHISHVRTQMPYALTVGLVSILFGILPAAYGLPTWICFLIGISILYLVVQFFGKKLTPSP